MKSKLLAATAAVAIALAGSANAATYITKIDWWNVGGLNQVNPAFGEVLIEELGDGKTVKFTATIAGDDVWQQSGNYPNGNTLFAFNLADDGATQITENHTSPNVIYSPTSYTHAPWGTFTDHFYINASGKNGRVDPLVFTAYNANGLTFLGTGAVHNADGTVKSLGEGNQFASNAGGWWFMGHYQPMDGRDSDGDSENIGARDALCVAGCNTVVITPVPEPGTWALMILGFGAAGAALRSRRRVFATH